MSIPLLNSSFWNKKEKNLNIFLSIKHSSHIKHKPHTHIYICLQIFNSKSNWKWRVTFEWRNFSHNFFFCTYLISFFSHFRESEEFIFYKMSSSVCAMHIYMHKWFSVYFFPLSLFFFFMLPMIRYERFAAFFLCYWRWT